MLKKIFLMLSFGSFLLTIPGCSFFFNEAVNTNYCKKCKVVNQKRNEIIWSEEGCGGGMTNIEDDAKIEAYEENSKRLDCNFEVECEKWKKEETEEDEGD